MPVLLIVPLLLLIVSSFLIMPSLLIVPSMVNVLPLTMINVPPLSIVIVPVYVKSLFTVYVLPAAIVIFWPAFSVVNSMDVLVYSYLGSLPYTQYVVCVGNGSRYSLGALVFQSEPSHLLVVLSSTFILTQSVLLIVFPEKPSSL